MRRSNIFEFLNRQPVFLTGKMVSLRPRKLEDCTNEFRWRTDEELCRLDATVPLSFSYAEFLDRYSIELEYPGLTYTLAVDTLEGYGAEAMEIFTHHIFDTSDIEKIVLRTLDWNTRAQKCFEKCGFTGSGNLILGEYHFLVMESHHPPKPKTV